MKSSYCIFLFNQISKKMQTGPSTKMKITRFVARIMSAIMVGFAIIMFIGESMESSKKVNSEPLTTNAMFQLILFSIGLSGLIIAWKWEKLGGIISLLAFISIFIVNPAALLWPMFIFPAIAILFIVVGYDSKNSKANLIK